MKYGGHLTWENHCHARTFAFFNISAERLQKAFYVCPADSSADRTPENRFQSGFVFSIYRHGYMMSFIDVKIKTYCHFRSTSIA